MIFYGVQIADRQLSALFELLRFVVEPDAVRRAHITVRGPYQDEIDISRFAAMRLGPIRIGGVGNFFPDGQSTVFFHCS
jgi:hypothetical protein